jgi:hypothetical protein
VPAYSLNGSNQYLISSAALTPLTNFSVYMRVKFASVAGNVALFCAGDTVTNNENYILRVGSSELWVGTYNGAGGAAKITGLSLTTGVWYDIIAVWSASNERIIYNGTTRTTDTTSLALTSTNRTVFGAELFAGAPGSYVNGSICDMAIWGTSLLTPSSDLSEVDLLFNTFSPRRIRLGAITDYWPQYRVDGKGIKGNALTLTNSPGIDKDTSRIFW